MVYGNKYCPRTFDDGKFEEIEFVQICENWPTLNLPLVDSFIRANINSLKILKNAPDMVYPMNLKLDYFSLRPEDCISFTLSVWSITRKK